MNLSLTNLSFGRNKKSSATGLILALLLSAVIWATNPIFRYDRMIFPHQLKETSPLLIGVLVVILLPAAISYFNGGFMFGWLSDVVILSTIHFLHYEAGFGAQIFVPPVSPPILYYVLVAALVGIVFATVGHLLGGHLSRTDLDDMFVSE